MNEILPRVALLALPAVVVAFSSGSACAEDDAIATEIRFLREALDRPGLSDRERAEVKFFYRVPVLLDRLSRELRMKEMRQDDHGTFVRGTFLRSETLVICDGQYASMDGKARDSGVVLLNMGTVTLISNWPVAERKKSLQREFMVIRWGRRVYLVEADRMISFCNAVNDSSEPRQHVAQGAFFLELESAPNEVDGLPRVPAAFENYLLRQPADLRVLTVERQVVDHTVPALDRKISGRLCELEGARGSGLLPAMKIYSIGAAPRAKGYILKVDDDRCTAIIEGDVEHISLGQSFSTVKSPAR